MRIRTAACALAALLLVSCQGSSWALIPESIMNSLGASAYEEETAKYPIITSGAEYEMVQRLGDRIATACGQSYEWEFRLLDAPDVANAFALPGGKVAVYTGLLPLTKNEDGLAAVVGHEVAHVVLEHGNQRMTQNMASTLGLMAAQYGLSVSDLDEADRVGWMQAIGLGAQVGFLLPYSRHHETEADILGLRYLVRAGYDPNEAPKLWERMAAASGSGSELDLFSTHPPSLERARRLREAIPQIVAEESGSE